MRFGLLVAVIALLVVGSDVLLDQWISGYASAEFILGTAALIIGICIGLFAIIAAIGLALGTVLERSGDGTRVDRGSEQARPWETS
jgi:hypothetical protein